jgi:hypothetical protein
MLAFDRGSPTWTLGFTTAPAQRPRIRTMPAGDLVTLVKAIQLAASSCRSCHSAHRQVFSVLLRIAVEAAVRRRNALVDEIALPCAVRGPVDRVHGAIA